MSRPPDLRDLIGDEGSPDERARLEHVHDMLVTAGPPPEDVVPGPPRVSGAVVRLRPRPRRWAELAVAAAVVVVAVGAGYFVGNRGNGFESVATITMRGVPPVVAATAELDIGKSDADGNVPIKMRVAGLPSLPRGGWYELYLSKNGARGESCGTFTTAGKETTVRLNVGYDLAGWRKAGRYDGWVITAHVPGKPASAKRILLTT